MRLTLSVTVAVLLAAVSLAAQQPQAPAGPTPPGVFLTIGGESTSGDGATPLHSAVASDDLPRVQQLIRARANVNAANRYGVTPLALAALSGNAGVVDALLKAGADPNSAAGEGETILMTAARSGSVEAVNALLRAGANPNAREGWHGQTPLMWAAVEDHPEVVRALLTHNADVNLASTHQQTPALVAGLGPKKLDLAGFRIPLAKGGMTALHYAARAGNLESVKALASAPGVDLNVGDADGITPLIFAAMNGHYETAAYLLEKGADPNRVDAYGRSMLYGTIELNKPEWTPQPELGIGERVRPLELAKLAIAKGANPNIQLKEKAPVRCANSCPNTSQPGATPIWAAGRSSDVEALKLLMAAGGDPLVTARDGTNALMLAAGQGFREGRTPGTEAESLETINVLLAAGLNVNAANAKGETALHGAADRGAPEIVKLLVERGADLTVKDKFGRTPLDVASNVPEEAGALGVGGVVEDPPKGREATAKVLRELMVARGLPIERSTPPAATPAP